MKEFPWCLHCRIDMVQACRTTEWKGGVINSKIMRTQPMETVATEVQPFITKQEFRTSAAIPSNWKKKKSCAFGYSYDHWKRPWCWERLKARGEGDDRGWDGWMSSLTQWTWVYVNSRSWWWTARPGVLQSMGSQRVRHDWATELTDWLMNLSAFRAIV